MRRLNVYTIQDTLRLSWIFDQLMLTLEASPMAVKSRALAYDTQIEERIFFRLRNLHRNPSDAPNIEPNDYRVVFSNVLFRYPTVRMWQMDNGGIYFEM